MIRPRQLLLGALAYAAITFPLAYWWHLVAFADLYQRLHFVTLAEPRVALGFVTIVSQGFLLSAAFQVYHRGPTTIGSGLQFTALLGTFFWSGVVIAHVAKHDVGSTGTFIAMETLYFLIQFGLYGAALGLIHARGPLRETARA
jgi:hypothetical protein